MDKKRLIWEGMHSQSIQEGAASAILNSNFFVFDDTAAQRFAVNGELEIRVTISMAQGMTTRIE